MSNHQTNGWNRYEEYVQQLRERGISVMEVPDCGLGQIGQMLLIRGYDSDHDCFCSNEGKHCPCCDGTCHHLQHLRLAYYTILSDKNMVIEEWLKIDDQDSDEGVSMVDAIIYPEGCRPNLKTEIFADR